jgi:glycosyltransferase involved in cell wall biosynthesis
MNVAFVLGTSGGGTGAHVLMLATGCAARDVTAQVLGPVATDRALRLSGQVTFVPVEIADRPRLPHDLRAIARLRRLLKAGSFDVVHAHGMRAGALSALALKAWRQAPPLIVTVHNAPAAGGAVGAIYRALERIVARSADSVLCVSADLEERMRAAGARRVAPAIVPAPSASPPSASPSNSPQPNDSAPGAVAEERATAASPSRAPVVLAVGRLASQKGHDVLIAAATHWHDLEPRPQLMIVGVGPLETELKAQAASLAVPAEFTGQRSDVPALLATADVFVLPSRWEGQALILQEALRAGAPIVATRVGGNPALTGEDAALLVPPDDPVKFADAVRAILADPALSSSLRKAALHRAETLPGEDTAVSAVLAEYRALTAGHAASA